MIELIYKTEKWNKFYLNLYDISPLKRQNIRDRAAINSLTDDIRSRLDKIGAFAIVSCWTHGSYTSYTLVQFAYSLSETKTLWKILIQWTGYGDGFQNIYFRKSKQKSQYTGDGNVTTNMVRDCKCHMNNEDYDEPYFQ